MVASVFHIREQVTGKRAILSAGNEAACEALTTGTSKVPGALLLVFALWDIAAERDIGLWAERVPAGANPADLPRVTRSSPFRLSRLKISLH